MKAATRDWVQKAEHDFLAAVDLGRRRKKPLHDMVCFHCQQAAEKYLKARLEEAAIHFPKTRAFGRSFSVSVNRCFGRRKAQDPVAPHRPLLTSPKHRAAGNRMHRER